MGKKLKQYLSKGLQIGKNIASVGASAAKNAVKLGANAAKIGAKIAKFSSKVGYKAATKGLQHGLAGGKIAYAGAKKAYQKAKQMAPKIKQKLKQSKDIVSSKLQNASRAFKRLIHSQQLLTIGKIIDSKKSDSYKTFLIRKYIEGLRKGQEVPIDIVDQIQQSLLDKIVESNLNPIRMTESTMIPDQQEEQPMRKTLKTSSVQKRSTRKKKK